MIIFQCSKYFLEASSKEWTSNYSFYIFLYNNWLSHRFSSCPPISAPIASSSWWFPSHTLPCQRTMRVHQLWSFVHCWWGNSLDEEWDGMRISGNKLEWWVMHQHINYDCLKKVQKQSRSRILSLSKAIWSLFSCSSKAPRAAIRLVFIAFLVLSWADAMNCSTVVPLICTGWSMCESWLLDFALWLHSKNKSSQTKLHDTVVTIPTKFQTI